MRVVVHHPARVEDDGTEVAESVSAYRLGHVTDFTNPITGETTPAEEVVKALVEQAQAEYPDCEVSVEHLHVAERHPETNEVIAHEWKDHPPEEAVAAGEQHEQTLTADQAQEAS